MVTYTLDVNAFTEKLLIAKEGEHLERFSEQEINFFRFAKERDSNDLSLNDLNMFLFNLQNLLDKYEELNHKVYSDLSMIENAKNVKGGKTWW